MKIKKILISQPKPEAGKSPYYDIAEKYNIKVDFRPFIKVEAIAAKEFRTQKVNIADFSAVVFTSRTGADHFFRLCEELRVKLTEEIKYFCTSETIGFYLQKYVNFRKRKVFNSPSGKLTDLFALMNKHTAENFLFVLPENNNEEIFELLKNVKFKYKVAVMYRTVSNNFIENETFDYDMLLFFSPQGIASLLKNFPAFQQKETFIGCLGAATAQAIRDAGLRVDLEVPNPTFSSLSMALDDFIKQNQKNIKAKG
ncbi:MAG: uroporphyrinogen-III synthase [Prevotellaceae bacterium]|nr:uroporphyrinogen-III synthase [Prevotellaceae bacterium]